MLSFSSTPNLLLVLRPASNPSAPFLKFQQNILPDVQLLLSSLRISQRRIAEIKQHGKFVKVLAEMSERRKVEIELGLEGVGWAVDDAFVLRAIVGNGGIEDVRHRESP